MPSSAAESEEGMHASSPPWACRECSGLTSQLQVEVCAEGARELGDSEARWGAGVQQGPWALQRHQRKVPCVSTSIQLVFTGSPPRSPSSQPSPDTQCSHFQVQSGPSSVPHLFSSLFYLWGLLLCAGLGEHLCGHEVQKCHRWGEVRGGGCWVLFRVQGPLPTQVVLHSSSQP